MRWVAASAFCFLLSAFAGCAKTPPVTVPSAPQTTVSAVERLRQDLLDVTRRPCVARAAWGIVVQSLDRRERLFELNAGTLLVPASPPSS